MAPVVPVANFAQMNEDELLTYLSQRRGLWHEMATALSRLYAMGVASELINDICSLSPKEQNLWVVGSSVFYSLIASPLCSEVVGRYFNASGQAELYELRILQDKERIKTAIYVAENQLDNDMTKYLARAIRSYLTRSDIARREGFSDSVGDMLALNYYREALEVKGEERELFAQKGVDCATSSEAKLNLQRLLLLDTSGEEDELSKYASLPAVALEDHEEAFWPLPVMGSLETVTSSLFNNIPVTNTDGPFNLFKPSGGVKWTALPLFSPIATADDPVGLIINDTATLKEIPALSERGGECLLIVDRGKRAPSADGYFVVFSKSTLVGLGGGDAMEKAAIMAGADVAGSADLRVAGKVVLSVRPSDMAGVSSYANGDAVVQVDKDAL